MIKTSNMLKMISPPTTNKTICPVRFFVICPTPATMNGQYLLVSGASSGTTFRAIQPTTNRETRANTVNSAHPQILLYHQSTSVMIQLMESGKKCSMMEVVRMVTKMRPITSNIQDKTFI